MLTGHRMRPLQITKGTPSRSWSKADDGEAETNRARSDPREAEPLKPTSSYGARAQLVMRRPDRPPVSPGRRYGLGGSPIIRCTRARRSGGRTAGAVQAGAIECRLKPAVQEPASRCRPSRPPRRGPADTIRY